MNVDVDPTAASSASSAKPTPTAPQEPDRPPLFPIVVVSLLSLLVLAAAIGTAALMAGPIPAPPAASAAPQHMGHEHRHTSHQTPIDGPAYGAEAKRRARAELESYGWIDRERGVAHVPVEVAKELLVARGTP